MDASWFCLARYYLNQIDSALSCEVRYLLLAYWIFLDDIASNRINNQQEPSNNEKRGSWFFHILSWWLCLSDLKRSACFRRRTRNQMHGRRAWSMITRDASSRRKKFGGKSPEERLSVPEKCAVEKKVHLHHLSVVRATCRKPPPTTTMTTDDDDNEQWPSAALVDQ